MALPLEHSQDDRKWNERPSWNRSRLRARKRICYRDCRRKTKNIELEQVMSVEVDTTPEEAERYWQSFPPTQAENVVPMAQEA